MLNIIKNVADLFRFLFTKDPFDIGSALDITDDDLQNERQLALKYHFYDGHRSRQNHSHGRKNRQY